MRSSRCCRGATRWRLRSDESPYAGLRSFQEADAHRFFGRSRDVAAAVARLRDVPLLGIVGPSGVGKSSFVRAWHRCPALKASGEQWSTDVAAPGPQPDGGAGGRAGADGDGVRERVGRATDRVIAPPTGMITTTGDPAQHQQLLERLYAEPGVPRGRAARAGAEPRAAHILVFIDQFEELPRRSRISASGSRSRRAWRASVTTSPRRSGWCCRCARTSSITWPSAAL